MEMLAPLPVIVPLVAATTLVLLEKFPGKRRLLDLIGLTTATAVLLLDLLLLRSSLDATIVYWFGGWQTMQGFPLGICFVIDPAAAGLAALAAFLTSMALLFSWHYFKAIGIFYHTLMLLFLAAMEGFCLTGDLFNMFVFFELMGVAAYALTGYHIEDTGPLEGALNFSVMNSVGGILVLIGIGMVYSETGGLNMAWAGERIAATGCDRALLAAFMLLVIGYMIKGAIIPFHFWLPDAHAVAPTPVSILFSGIMVELGLYAIARVYWVLFAGSLPVDLLRTLLIAVGLATATVGACMCFIQRHLKRLLAFSTVSHSGLILAGIALLTTEGFSGALLYLAGHGLIKGGLFICAGIVLHRYGSVDEELLRKRGPMKVIGAWYGLCGVALAGLPGFGPWRGKEIMEKAAAGLGYDWVTAFFIFASAITGAAVLRAGGAIFYGLGDANLLSSSAPSAGEREMPETTGKSSPPIIFMWLPLLLMLAAALAVGMAPQAVTVADQAAARFTDSAGYRALVLTDVAQSQVGTGPGHVQGIGMGIMGALLAVLIAAAALYSSRLPAWALKIVQVIAEPLLRFFRGIHSGYIGDYVTWFVLGMALLLLSAVRFQ